MLGEVEKILENDGDLVDAYNIDQSAYRDWAHINEPNCAVKNALEAGNIHPKRYASYLTLIT
jgi:putative ribosome biogenesis GTPase RsgA